MLHTTTIHVTRTKNNLDPELQKLKELGVDTEDEETEETKFYRFQFDVGDIIYAHEHELEVEDEIKYGTIIFFEDGMQIHSMESFDKISELRRKYEDKT